MSFPLPGLSCPSFKLAKAEANDPVSQLEVATIYDNNNQFNKGLEWLQKAVQLNYHPAQLRLALFHLGGVGMPKNLSEATILLNKAAEQGNAVAQFHLGFLYASGQLQDTGNLAITWYLKAAQHGNVNAQFNLGMCYKVGDCNVEQSFKEAFSWLLRASAQGFAPAQFNLGLLYQNGHGVEESSESAKKWLGLAAEQGYTLAQFAFGKLLLKEAESDPDKLPEAVRQLSDAAMQGHAAASYQLAQLYGKEFGKGGTKCDLVTSCKYLEMAANEGHLLAQINLAAHYEQGKGVPRDYSKSIDWYTRAAEQGHLSSLYTIAGYFKKGRGVKRNYPRAFTYFKLAADKGHVEAQFKLAQMYEKGQGCTRDLILAEKWYREAAEIGYPQAQFKLGMFYRKGIVVKKDLTQAFNWISEAAKGDWPNAQFMAGYFYEKGFGTEIDLPLAFANYKLAANSGHVLAQSYLSRFYEEGLATEKDEEMAKLWSTLASSAKAHHDKKQNAYREALTRIYPSLVVGVVPSGETKESVIPSAAPLIPPTHVNTQEAVSSA